MKIAGKPKRRHLKNNLAHSGYQAHVLAETLDVFSKANNFNKWLYGAIKLKCYGRVLEIGSGTGNISSFFIQDNFQIVLSDVDFTFCEILKKKYRDQVNVHQIIQLDLVHPHFDTIFKHYFQFFDTIVALNVIEHIKDDGLAFQNCNKLLKKNGSLIVLLPAYKKLYNMLDINLGHFRRYQKHDLQKLFIDHHFARFECFYFNFIGIFPWYIFGKILKVSHLSHRWIGFYNVLVPIFKLIDRLSFHSAGLSIIGIGKKI